MAAALPFPGQPQVVATPLVDSVSGAPKMVELHERQKQRVTRTALSGPHSECDGAYDSAACQEAMFYFILKYANSTHIKCYFNHIRVTNKVT
ncbi:hypothetical protein EIB18_03245 [Caulobacter vibrioides]|uniref:Uncharacterized protein n=2 Tax=Caulobacter vibrioides TaxID=155892 RepID=Q9AAJ3_CAUVC|nr:hypothetical protein [Caulobacter vibrioides]YP_002516013.1 hypothetical protein CCNA_00640 [Caulobacter vibrioides NA1000]AAK22590.1 hypothetical protein CC_0604 [Caulobacter vibrioides CB15]ACL94105.1 hypothetical protein CCNA_00640 [Caulobacter vibrioides NA1000]ATC27449.1 hypothetical protein CA607_03230 [Caulobacter vibrioides]AZH11826.1 hypothetical protein EIB18_03245 [Caulobacter vibrioides]QXZ52686.1 hypothetical protein KZH45_03125 [Caulobacter vibrioides]